MGVSYSEKRVIFTIKDTVIKGRFSDARIITRYTSKDLSRVIYRVPTRNKAISLLVSSPIKDTELQEGTQNQVITLLKVFKGGGKFLILPLTALNVNSSLCMDDLRYYLNSELSNVFDVDFADWKPYESLKKERQVMVWRGMYHGVLLPLNATKNVVKEDSSKPKASSVKVSTLKTKKQPEIVIDLTSARESELIMSKLETFSRRNGKPCVSSLTAEMIKSKNYRTTLQRLWCEVLNSNQRAYHVNARNKRAKHFDVSNEYEARNIHRLRWVEGKTVEEIIQDYGFARDDVKRVLRGEYFIEVHQRYGRRVMDSARKRKLKSNPDRGLVLKASQVREILYVRFVSKLTYKSIADKYNVSGETIRLICTGKLWNPIYEEFMKSTSFHC